MSLTQMMVFYSESNPNYTLVSANQVIDKADATSTLVGQMNTVKEGGLSPRFLTLIIGCSIMVLGNLNGPKEL